MSNYAIMYLNNIAKAVSGHPLGYFSEVNNEISKVQSNQLSFD